MSDVPSGSSSSIPRCATASRPRASAFSARDKVEIAQALAAMRVDVIEAGFPAARAAERRAVRAVARAGARRARSARSRARCRSTSTPRREALRRRPRRRASTSS